MRLDLGGPSRVRVPLAMQMDVAFNPIEVSVPDAGVVFRQPNPVAGAVELMRRVGLVH
jgi:hypothetical protein